MTTKDAYGDELTTALTFVFQLHGPKAPKHAGKWVNRGGRPNLSTEPIRGKVAGTVTVAVKDLDRKDLDWQPRDATVVILVPYVGTKGGELRPRFAEFAEQARLAVESHIPGVEALIVQ